MEYLYLYFSLLIIRCDFLGGNLLFTEVLALKKRRGTEVPQGAVGGSLSFKDIQNFPVSPEVFGGTGGELESYPYFPILEEYVGVFQ